MSYILLFHFTSFSGMLLFHYGLWIVAWISLLLDSLGSVV